MEYSSKQFAVQARFDLEQAQAIARANTSGEALGTAMFLAQQSMEKQFKSALLKVGESLGAGLDEGFFKRALSHAVHQHPGKFYQKCLEAIGRIDDPTAGKIVKKRLCQLEHIGKIWDPGFYDSEIRFLLFQYYLEVDLPQGDRDKLDAHLASIFEKINMCDNSSESPKHRFSSAHKSAPMDSVISDKGKLQEHRDWLASLPHNVSVRHEMEQVFGRRLDIINQIIEGRRLATGAPGRSEAALMILDYGALAVVMHSPNYVHLFPHYLLGRYPTRLPTGRLCTEIYASQRDAVLSRLFVNVQYDHDQLCQASERVGELCAIYQMGGL